MITLSNSKELDVPGEPFGTTAFISYIMSQVSLPYRRQTAKEIVRQRGNLVVKYVATGKALPYGKYPRLMEMYACTMIKRPQLPYRYQDSRSRLVVPRFPQNAERSRGWPSASNDKAAA